MQKVLVWAMFSVGVLLVACTKDSVGEPMEDPNSSNPGQTAERKVWTGDTVEFSKAAESDPTIASNQDRITDKVWITRGNDGGQIINAKSENSYNKDLSPVGTKWAIGTIDQIDDLDFKTFRAAIDKPKNVVGKNLVMHLEDENIYLSVKFTAWSTQKVGAFTYERSSE